MLNWDMIKFIFFITLLGSAYCDKHHARTNQFPGRTTIVHLFEWKWRDIADECERFLGPKGFGGIQISPPSENVIIHLSDGTRPWYERYQSMSYKLTTRSGNEEDFKEMTTRCNAVGVRIYADIVINHMTGNFAGDDNIGTGGSQANFYSFEYPGVPYTYGNFHHPECFVENYNNATEVRNCQLLGLKDLNQGVEYVRSKIVEFLNHLINLGVAGFRVDSAKHMWPKDLRVIYNALEDLNTDFGFKPSSKAYIYQEVSDYGFEAVSHSDYIPLGDVTEFRVGTSLVNVFRRQNDLRWLINWGPGWGMSPSNNVLVFIDNHDSQRHNDVLTYKEARAYKAAIAFLLAHPYGSPRIMSSYFFDNNAQGPPSDRYENIISPSMFQNDTCGTKWVCEHRWRQIYQMVAFRNAVGDAELDNWWNNNHNQIAFSRNGRGFVVFNLEDYDLYETLQTGLPAGEYCDVITGNKVGNNCTGAKVEVMSDGKAKIYLSNRYEDYHLAIHIGPESSLSTAAKNVFNFKG